MKNLGRMILIMIVTQTIMIASIAAKLERNPIMEGEAAVLVLEAEGLDVVFPDIKEIAGYTITNKTTTRSITSINGKVNKTLIRKYSFSPRKEGIIPSLKVIIDGEEVSTKPINFKIKTDMKDGKKAFTFEQKVDKSEVYVGEPISLTYTFKQRRDVDLSEVQFNASSFSNFWAKTTKKVPNVQEGDYNVYRIKYLLYPQKSGDLKIESGRMDVGILSTQKRDFFNFQQVRWKTLYSNTLDIKVKELPEGVALYGDYTFTVVVDKNSTKANEPVNLTITIQGDGNMDDIDDFEIEVPNATVYADKSKKNMGIFKQKFAIVSDRNFTIPSLGFTFFNGEVQKLHSREFKIMVKNAKVQKALSMLEKKSVVTDPEVQVVVEKASTMTIMITALLSFLGGVVATLLYRTWSGRKKEHSEKPITARIKNAKEDKALLALLLPYADKTPKMQRVIKQLEENVYQGTSHTIDRKKLSSAFETYLMIDKKDEILDV